MKTLLLSITFTLTSIISMAQTNDLPDREAFKLTLAVDETNYYSADIESSAFILQENTIQIYPGEKVFVEVELDKNEIKSMKTVKKNINPEKTMIISFSQRKTGKLHEGMMLYIQNPFDKSLMYKANIFLLKANKWRPTSVIPVGGKLSSFETWPDEIVTIGLYDWTFE